MSDDKVDRKLYDLVYEALVPPGHRPETDADIEAMLDACAGGPMPDVQLERMMRLIEGRGPSAGAKQPDEDPGLTSLTELQRDLVALHKAQGKELPPEIAELLRKFREEAREERQKGRDGE